MLCANVAAAKFLEKHQLEALYRVHQGPSEERLKNLREFLGEQGIDLPGGDDPSPADYQAVMAQIEDRPDAHIIQTMLLRSMQQAVYQPENEGHFGLNYEGYTHFTSPIRRYPDLLVHRAIRFIVRSQPGHKTVRSVDGVEPLPRKAIYPYQLKDLLALGEQTSLTERRADDATREVVAWLKCEYLQDKVGEVFQGVVSAVTGFGLFVELTDVYVEGLVHVSALDSDYYSFDQAKQRLVGERTRTTFQLGDELTVKVVRVNLDDKKIDLELVGLATGSNRRKRKANSAKKSEQMTRQQKPKAKKSAKKSSAKSSDNQSDKKSTKKKAKKAKEKKKAGKKTAKTVVKETIAKVRKRLRKK